ncbi:MAG TPA: heparan-alpha-glucosaminide N-acetyltransferase domain-containing protein [Gemmatimonadales bacterium]|jgi:uncharacterized membrane protein
MTASARANPSSRISSIDLVRGVVMVLMAIDHVRVYSGQPAGGPTAGIFFTRWVTHFVAPGFAFFAGTGAFFHGRKLGDLKALSRFLVTRGLFLVFLELTVLRFCWTFNFDYAHYMLAGVIWMLGWCMVLMAGVVRLPLKAIGWLGLILMIGQNVLGLLNGLPWPLNWVARIVYLGGNIELVKGGTNLPILFVIVPWIGVMAAGYWFGSVMLRSPEERDRWCLRVGVAATALFLVLGSIVAIKAGPGPTGRPFLFRLLGQQKYPASQLFLMMTLGPTLAFLPLAARARGWLANAFVTLGRVPLFYYLLHIPLIHVAAIVVSLIRTGSVTPWLFTNHPLWPPEPPAGYIWPLPLLYLVFAICVVLLYFPCRWYAGLKARKTSRWLSFI